MGAQASPGWGPALSLPKGGRKTSHELVSTSCVFHDSRGAGLARIHRRTPMDGVRKRGEGRRDYPGLIRVGGRSPGGLQALLGAPMAVYDGPKMRTEDTEGTARGPGWREFAGTFGCAVGSSVADGAVK